MSKLFNIVVALVIIGILVYFVWSNYLATATIQLNKTLGTGSNGSIITTVNVQYGHSSLSALLLSIKGNGVNASVQLLNSSLNYSNYSAVRYTVNFIGLVPNSTYAVSLAASGSCTQSQNATCEASNFAYSSEKVLKAGPEGSAANVGFTVN